MKALRFRKFGPPSVLAIEEVPRPEPHGGEALVQVQAAAINPSDVKNVSGYFPATTLPRTPGRDFAGIVVTGKKYEGQEVWGSGPGLGTTRDGAQAEYVVVSEEAVSPKPRTLSFEQAAAIGVPFITAWCALVETAQLDAGRDSRKSRRPKEARQISRRSCSCQAYCRLRCKVGRFRNRREFLYEAGLCGNLTHCLASKG
jgi:NADPH:quinone reductase-like Zn-dependent oxidoreductase